MPEEGGQFPHGGIFFLLLLFSFILRDRLLWRTKLRGKMLLRSKVTKGNVLILYDLIVEQMLNRIIQGPECFWDSFFF